jgi:SulP family sulfate permease
MKGKWTGRFAGYNAEFLRRDLLSGLIVGIIAIPLGMAFAIASGVNPQYGIYTTIVAGVLISLFGGSRFQIGGPTGAFVPVLLMIVMQYGYENLLIAGCMAGIILVLMGLFKLGALIQFIPRPVTLGFTAGIAVILYFSQHGKGHLLWCHRYYFSSFVGSSCNPIASRISSITSLTAPPTMSIGDTSS